MSDPERLEKALPDLLHRAGWSGPPADPLEPLDPSEQERWQALLAEPATGPGRFPASRLATLGSLAAAGLVLAVGLNTWLRPGALQESEAPLPAAPPQLPVAPTLPPSPVPEGTRKRVATEPAPSPVRAQVDEEKPQTAPPPRRAMASRPVTSTNPVASGPAGQGEAARITAADSASEERADQKSSLATAPGEPALPPPPLAPAQPQGRVDGEPTSAPASAKVAADQATERSLADRERSNLAAGPTAFVVVAAPGMAPVALASLQRWIVESGLGGAGSATFDLAWAGGQVSRAELLPDASQLPAQTAEILRQRLLTWKPPAGTTGVVRVELRAVSGG